MKKFAQIMLLTLGFGVFAVVLSLYPSQPAAADKPGTIDPVLVTNTPLPVTGNVNAAVTSLPPVQISGTPSVNATITNTPVPVSGQVEVTNFPTAAGDVTVKNTATNPVPTLATDALSGFVASNYCYFNSNYPTDMCVIDPLYSVPAGKIAVLESASGACVTSSTDGMREFQLQLTDPAGNYGQLGFPPTNVVTPGSDSMNKGAVGTTAQNFKSYASGGSSIKFLGFAAENQSSNMFCRFTVSGHLVSAQ
jgi:hypothetical protein